MRQVRTALLMSLLPFIANAQSAYDVTFKAFTAFGDPVAVRVLALSDPLHHRDVMPQCAGAICTAIPEGPYTYSVAIAETGRKVDGTSVIYRKNQVVVVDVGTPTYDLDDSDFPTISGTVTPVAGQPNLWIRMLQLYGDISLAAAVQKNGSFELDQVRPGNWMLLVFNGGKLIHSEPFVCKTTGNTTLKINLSGADLAKSHAQPQTTRK